MSNIKEALEHASVSYHHPKCPFGKKGNGNTCTCHVQKAKDALAELAKEKAFIQYLDTGVISDKKKAKKEYRGKHFETTVEVCCHTVSLRYWDFKAKLTPELEQELTDSGEERAKECIIDGCHSGDLNCLHTTKNSDEEIRGWWEIDRS